MINRIRSLFFWRCDLKCTYVVLDYFFAPPRPKMVDVAVVVSLHSPTTHGTTCTATENRVYNFQALKLPLDMMPNSHSTQPFDKCHSQHVVNYPIAMPNIVLAARSVCLGRLMHFGHDDLIYPAILLRIN